MHLITTVASILAISCLTLQFIASSPQIQPGADLVQQLSNDIKKALKGILDNNVGSFGLQRTPLDLYRQRVVSCSDTECLLSDPDVKRNVSEIIRSRGFEVQELDVTTRDGYLLTIQRIINPLVDEEYRPKLKPVILQHGLLASSADWIVNSVNVHPVKYPPNSYAYQSTLSDNTIESHLRSLQDDLQEHPNSLGYYLANQGYDVFLANSRGNIYGQRHVKMSAWLPKFWDFSFDEQIKYDLPDTIDYIQHMTAHKKIGYVGHSQGTTMIFGLLADRPEYADIVEPVIALAPVAYVNNVISPARHFAIYTPIFQHINMWFGTSNAAVRYLTPLVCKPNLIRKDICTNIMFLSAGFDEAELNETRISAYLSHVPSGTSIKNLAHWGQEVKSGKFAHFDHGVLANQIVYGRSSPPEYDLGKIRSRSISLFTAENDWLAAPKDVARLKADLKVPLFKAVNVTNLAPKWNHIDFVYGKDSGRFVNAQIVDIFKHFD